MINDDMNSDRINKMVQKAQGVPVHQLASELNLTCSFLLHDTEEYFTGTISHELLENVYQKTESLSYAIMYSIEEELYGDKKFFAIKARKEGFDLLEALQKLFDTLEGSEQNKKTEEMLKNSFTDMRLAFIEYVNSFDKTKFEIDPWGVLNPPGVDVENDY